MKALLVATILCATTFGAAAQYGGSSGNGLYGSSGLYGTGSNPNSHYVSPYTRSDGAYVGGHYQTNPNSTQLDNYGTRGNLNPYTGTYGTRTPRY
jgi:hypothetical protein